MNVLLLEKPLWEVSDSSAQPGGVTHQSRFRGKAIVFGGPRHPLQGSKVTQHGQT